MRLVSYTSDGRGLRAGLLIDETVMDAAAVAARAGDGAPVPADGEGLSVRALLAGDADRLLALETVARDGAAALSRQGAVHALSDVRLGPPVPDPQKIVCLGLNYSDHARETGLTPPAVPMFFAKFPNSLIGPGDEIVSPGPITERIDYEAELAVVIGKRGAKISEADALSHVFGAMALNDVSARDLQMANNLWTGGKAIDTFAPCGPALVSLDELGDIQNLGLWTRVNGETVQDGNTSNQIFGVVRTIAFLSAMMTLEPGDIIATGTPAGVGSSRTPPLFLNDGDVVEVGVERIGTLRNRVAVPHQRSAG